LSSGRVGRTRPPPGLHSTPADLQFIAAGSPRRRKAA